MKTIHKELINETVAKAKLNKRLRINYNFHETYDAIVQRMLNAIEPGTYVQPHKHEDPDKAEVFIILTGKALIVEFDDTGEVISYNVIAAGGNNFGSEIAPRTWHSIVSLESGTVVYEVKDGPYSPLTDKNFAKWAPKEGDENCSHYLNELLKKCGLD